MRTYILYIVSVVLLLAASMTKSHADDGYADKTMCFVYIAQSELTSTDALEEYLDALTANGTTCGNPNA